MSKARTAVIAATLATTAAFGSLSLWKKNFLIPAIQNAQETQVATGVPASVTVAQAVLESGWGQSFLARNANNYFGIKAGAGWYGKTLSRGDWEYIRGRRVWVPAKWRVYTTPAQGFSDHAAFFFRNKRYAGALLCRTDATCFARRIHSAGYATDPVYSNKLISIINMFKLTRYDVPSSYWRIHPEFCTAQDRAAKRCLKQAESYNSIRSYLDKNVQAIIR